MPDINWNGDAASAPYISRYDQVNDNLVLAETNAGTVLLEYDGAQWNATQLDVEQLGAESIQNEPPNHPLINGRPQYFEGVETVDIDTYSATRTVNGNTYQIPLVPYYINGQLNLDATGDRSANSYLIPPYTSHRYAASEGSVSALFIRGDPNATGDIVNSVAFANNQDAQAKIKGLEFAGTDPGSDEGVHVAAYNATISIDQCTFDGADASNGVLAYGGQAHVGIEGETDLGGIGQAVVQKHGGTYGFLNGGATGSCGYLTSNGSVGPMCGVSDISDVTFSSGLHRRDGTRTPTFNSDTGHILGGYGAEGAEGVMTANTTVPGDNSVTKLPLTAAAYEDAGGAFRNSSDRLEATSAGRFLITATVTHDAVPAGGRFEILASLNGGTEARGSSGENGTATTMTTAVDMAAGDAVEMQARNDTGTSVDAIGGGTATHMELHRIG